MSFIRFILLSIFSLSLLVVGGAASVAQTKLSAAEPAEVKPEPSKNPAAAKVRRSVPDTLMFTIDELNEIKARIAGGDVTKEAREQQAGNQPLYLNSIMYYGPKDWTIWINGTPIGPNQDFQSFQVTNITPRFVELLIPLSVQGMRPVKLEPNQTYISESGIVVEGRYP